jgi:hypothetical protein
MSLSETIASAEGRFHDVFESGRSRLRAVVDDAEKRVGERLPRLREQLDTWRDRSFEDAERIGGYVTDGLTWIGSRLPKVEMPFTTPFPSPEELVGSWFETNTRVLALQRKLSLAWIAALRPIGVARDDSEDEHVRSTA